MRQILLGARIWTPWHRGIRALDILWWTLRPGDRSGGQWEEMCRDVPGFHHLLHPTQPATTVYLGNTVKLGTCSVIKKRTIHLLSSLIKADLWSPLRRVVKSACCGSSNVKRWVLFIKKNCGAFVEPFPFCTEFPSSMTLTQWHPLCILQTPVNRESWTQ